MPSIMRAVRARPAKNPAGRIRVASGVYSYAPADAFRQKRPPTPVELVQSNRNAMYAMARLSAVSVAQQPLRLYVTTTGGRGEKAPRCRTKAIDRAREKALANSPTISKKLAGVDRVEEVTDHPILDLLDYVNPWLDRFQLLYMTQAYQEIVGTAFWYFVDGVGNRPIELWPLPSWMVDVQPDYVGTDVIRNFIFTGGGGQAVLEPDQILFFRALSLHDPYVGSWSPLRASYDYAQIHDKGIAYRDANLTNRGRPDAVLEPKEEGGEVVVDPDIVNRIRSEYEQEYSYGRAGRLFIAPGGMNLKPLSWSPQDMGEIEMARATLHDLARTMGISSPLVDGEAANRANFDAALLYHARYGVRPRCRELEENLNSNFVTRWDDSGRLFFAFDDPVPADKVLERETLIAYVGAGIMTRNEARAELGEAPFEGGDELMIANSLVPLARALEPPAPIVQQSGDGSPKPDEVPAGARENPEPEPVEESDDEPFDEGDDVEDEAESKAWEGKQRLPFADGPPIDKFNPNHDEMGRFASGSGLHAGATDAELVAHADAAGERLADHADPVSEIAREPHPSADPKEVAAWERTARRDVSDLDRGHKRDRAEMDKEHAAERRDLEREHAREVKDQAKEHATERRDQAKDHAAETDDDAPERHAAERAELVERHREERERLTEEHATAASDLAESHRENLEGLAESQRTERAEVIGNLVRDWHEQFGPDVYEDVGKAFVRKVRRHRDVPSASDLLRAVLSRRHLTDAYLTGAITTAQRLAVLAELRRDARAWLRAEATAVHDSLGSKALFGDTAAKVGEFFGKAKRFIREAMVAGVLALRHPAAVSAAELHALDLAHQEQVVYLDNFVREVLDEAQAIDPTFIARAEQYGAPVWGGPQNVVHASAAASGAITEERRLHVGEDEPCYVCVEQEDLGWSPIGSLLPIAATPCRWNCHCHFEYRDADGNELEIFGAPTIEDVQGYRNERDPWGQW